MEQVMIKYKIKNDLKSLLVINLDTFNGSKRKVLYIDGKRFSILLDKEDIESREIKKYLQHKWITIIKQEIPDIVVIKEEVKVSSPIKEEKKELKKSNGSKNAIKKKK